jgi:hypothetical protein
MRNAVDQHMQFKCESVTTIRNREGANASITESNSVGWFVINAVWSCRVV